MISGPVQYLTPDGKARLQSELEELTTVGRQEIARQATSGHPRGRPERKLWLHRDQAPAGHAGGPHTRDPGHTGPGRDRWKATGNGRAELGSTVVIREPGQTGRTLSDRWAAEAKPRDGRISHESPLGRALLGHHAGDHVEANTPGGMLSFEILSVE